MLRKMNKRYRQNPDMTYVFSGEDLETGNNRETIFYCWINVKYEVWESLISDFELDGRTFEVGGQPKGKKQRICF